MASQQDSQSQGFSGSISSKENVILLKEKKRLKLVGNASASLSLDGTLSNILAMKLNAASFFPVITSSLASQSRQQKSGILLQEGPQI